MAEYEIDGKDFATLEEFYDEISRVLIPDAWWGRNLDAFNDILRGGFGTPEGSFTLRWLNHDVSQRRLGYDETVRQLEMRLQRCHPSNRQSVAADRVRGHRERLEILREQEADLARTLATRRTRRRTRPPWPGSPTNATRSSPPKAPNRRRSSPAC